MLSTPASSLTDRIEVFYGNSKSIVISPKDKQGFVDELLKQNSG
ncbi:MAG: PH domain-containing protein, partial [Flavobacteriaceae bacterium]|nr:PH domain-containing protein [Flavobacteriaceae bacterium]